MEEPKLWGFIAKLHLYISKGEKNMKSVCPNTREFLYPTAREYLFDEVCEEIVCALKMRNWKVPGITVTFYDFSSGEQKYRMVSTVKGKDFKLWFFRSQGALPSSYHNNIAAVAEIRIPTQELHVYDDNSAPEYFLYIGNNWDEDGFMTDTKLLCKQPGDDKPYLSYQGEPDGKYKRFLIHETDLEREYNPNGENAKLSYAIAEIMREFKAYLEYQVLAYIKKYPVTDGQNNPFKPPAPGTFPASIGPVYCIGGSIDAKRIKQGKEDASKLAETDRYGMIGNYNLVQSNATTDGTVPKIAYNGFLWCIIGEVNEDTQVDIDEVRSHQFGSYQYIIRVKPANTNGIYIADRGAYLNRKREIREAMDGNRNVYHEDEIADIDLALARTLIPIMEYTGGFEQPIVLVSSDRELSLDEVELEGCLKDDGYMLRKISELRQA